MKYSGQISKMKVELGSPITYHLPIGKHLINMNELLGKNITFEFEGEIRCIACNNQIKKTFMQGYCYPCFISSPLTSECILKPELCKAHEGEARDMDWAKEHCLQDQYIYLSLTSHLKVGVTRHTQIPTRWIDQGAHKAIVFAKTPNRYLAGMIEKDISQYISDRTYWRKMLLGDYPEVDLKIEKQNLASKLNSKYQEYVVSNNKVVKLEYPQYEKPEKIKSLNFEKINKISGVLNGIKGQYLFINNDSVINIRKFTGYFISYM